MFKKISRLIYLFLVITKRQSDLWKYWDWKKTEAMKKEAKEILFSLPNF